MDHELTDALCAKHPKIFPQRRTLECGDGWYNIVDALCACIQSTVDASSGAIPQVEATHIGQKYGTLRFSYDGANPVIDALVMFADELSERTCETCGAPGTMYDDGGWINTLCDKHKSER